MTGAEIGVILGAVILGAFVKSVTGLGMPLIAIPLASLFVPTTVVVAAIAVPNLVQNFSLVWQTRSKRHGASGLAVFCSAGVVGAFIGASLAPRLPSAAVSAVLIALIGFYLWTMWSTGGIDLSQRQRRLGEIPVGAVSGFFQGVIGISGPTVAAWFQTIDIDRDTFVFSISTVFAITGSMQVAVLAGNGELTGGSLLTITLTAIVFATLPIGQRVRDRMNQEAFRKAVVTLIAATWVVEIVKFATEVVNFG